MASADNILLLSSLPAAASKINTLTTNPSGLVTKPVKRVRIDLRGENLNPILLKSNSDLAINRVFEFNSFIQPSNFEPQIYTEAHQIKIGD